MIRQPRKYSETARDFRSFGLSLLLHAAFALVLVVIFATRQSEITQAATQVFVLMGNSAVSSADAPSTEKLALQIHLPRITRSEVEPVRPETTQPAPTESLPTRTDRAPNGIPMSQAEFRRRHGNDATAQRISKVPAVIPRVQESFPLAPGAPASSGEAADASFGPNLLRDLKNVFVNSGIDRVGLITTVAFTLSADGRLINLRLIRSSGDDSFDSAVLTAFRKVRARNFSPDNIGKAYQVQFRSSDE